MGAAGQRFEPTLELWTPKPKSSRTTHYGLRITDYGLRVACRLVFHRCDCVDGLRWLVEPGSVDVVVTSPPYNLGTGYGAYDDTIPRAGYLEWTDEWVATVSEALAEEGSFFLNLGAKPSDPWVPFQVAEVVASSRYAAGPSTTNGQADNGESRCRHPYTFCC